MKQFLILVLWAFCHLPMIVAQEYLTSVRHFGVEEGLSHRDVLSVFQDSRGFIWLGTRYGLNRFDGKTFKWYTKEHNGLASNHIAFIAEDDAGHLWLFGRENQFNDRQWEYVITILDVYREATIPLDKKFGANPSIDTDKLALLFSTPDRAVYLSYDTRSFVRYTSKTGLEQLTYSEDDLFYLDLYSSRNTIWGLNDPAMELLEVDTNGTLLQIVPLGAKAEKGKLITESKQGKLWLEIADSFNLQYRKLYTYDKKDGLRAPFFPAVGNKNISFHWWASYYGQSQSDWLWFAGAPNFFALNTETGSLIDFSGEYPLMANGLTNQIFFDRDSTAWVGTENGLYQIQLERSLFTRYLYKDPEESALADLYSSRGIVQVGDRLYVNCINGKGGQVIDLSTGAFDSLKYTVNYPSGEPVKSQFPKGLFLGKNNKLWLGEGCVIKRDLKTGEDHLFLWREDIKPAYIWSFFEQSNGKMWLGTNLGLAELDTTNSEIRFYDQYNAYSGLEKQIVYAFLEKSPSEILLATSGGMYVLDPIKGIVDHFWTEAEPLKRLPNDFILHIHKDQDEVYWLATGGSGLVKLSFVNGREVEQLEQFTIADGLSNNNLYAIYEDQNEQLWISSDYGIIQFDKKTNQSKAYLPGDGVSYAEFNRVSHFQAPDGRIYFGSINGVTAFHPNEVTQRDKVYDKPLEITAFSKFDKEANSVVDKIADLIKNQMIILKPGERLFELSFALLDYNNNQHIRYAYQVEGVDQSWNYLPDGNLRINGLPYGKHTLRIRGQSSDGRFSINELFIPIRVLAPFYARSWFKWLMAGLVLVLTFAVFKWRTRSLKLRQAELEQQVRERTAQIEKDRKLISEQAEELRQLDQLKSRFFANVSHELRTPLTLILGPLSTILKRNTASSQDYPLLKMIQQNGKNLLKLTNEILDLSKLESSTLELKEEPVALFSFLHYLVSQFESHAQQQGILLIFQFEADKHLQALVDKPKFEKVVNNLLSNAIKFTGEGGQIRCVFQDQGQYLLLEVTDTGQGIHPNDLPHVFDRFYQSKQADAPTQGGTGIGLALCREFAQLFEGKIWVESEWKKGSRFFFQFPKKEVMGVPEISQLAATLPVPHTDIEALVPPASLPNVPTILLVEDNPGLRQYIQLVLQDQYNLIIAENGQVALERLTVGGGRLTVNDGWWTVDGGRWTVDGKRWVPDLILSDVMMPVMDGFQLLEHLKGSDQFRHIPVIMLTARAALGDKLKALRIGVDDYILKPFETEELIARIASLLKNSRERQLIYQSAVAETMQEEPSGPLLSKADLDWLEKLEHEIKEKIDDAQFNLSHLASQLFISERQLHRRIKNLTGLTPNKYIREIKLQKARNLLEEGIYSTVAEVSYAIGFSKADYFSKVFQERFGKLPSAYLLR